MQEVISAKASFLAERRRLAMFGSSNLTVSLLEPLKLSRTTTFSSGNVLLHYRPTGEGGRT